MHVLSREDFSTCVNNVLKKFPEVSQLNNYQAECLFNFIERRDVFAMLPTGFGKSLIFQMVPGFV
jgi:ATP-dependent DNA helicase RecQ